MIVAAVDRIPVLLLTGFLGSGKTTLLSRWLKSSDLAGAMVIVNELGEVGLDHELLASSSDVPLLLDNGCACCAASGDLIDTLERLFLDRLTRKIPRFTRLIIETTGVADPLPICEALLGHELIAERYVLDGVVTTFDAVDGLQRLPQFPEMARQLEAAAVVVVTKTDLAGPQRVAELQAVLPDRAPHARVLTSAEGDLPARIVLDAIASAEPFAGTNRTPVAAAHAEGVTTAFLPAARPLPFAAAMGALNDAITGRRETLVRLKGLVRFDGVPGLYAVQAVPGTGIARSLVPERAGAAVRTGFTIISREEPAAVVANAIRAHLERRKAADLPTHTGGA
jgi:G3E family GTPase